MTGSLRDSAVGEKRETRNLIQSFTKTSARGIPANEPERMADANQRSNRNHKRRKPQSRRQERIAGARREITRGHPLETNYTAEVRGKFGKIVNGWPDWG
jgi:hypothetical protein